MERLDYNDWYMCTKITQLEFRVTKIAQLYYPRNQYSLN